MPCLASTNSGGGQSLPPLPSKLPTTQAEWTLFIQRAQARDQAIASGALSLGVNVIPAQLTVYDAITVPPSVITGATAALSSTARFGTSSLQLTATGTTVVVTLGASGYPIPIAPNGQWIGSAYVQTSGTALAGTFAIVTPVATYAQNIGDSVQANTWNRLYDTFNLQADASTSCTVTLTFTGCTVGQTIDLEGFMLETTDGYKTLPSVFQVSSPPRTWTDIPDPGTKPANNADVTAANTSLDTAHVNGVTSASISPIATLMPAEAGANVTANHTANDTANVAGTPAATVVSTANTANTTANNLNMVNLSMAQGMLGWTAAPSSEAANWYGETGANGPNGGTSTYIVHKVSGITSTLDNTLMPCVPGQVIKAQGQCKGVGTPNGAAALFIAFYDINKALIGSPTNSNNVIGNGQFQLIATATAPSNAAFVTIGPSGGYASSPVGYYTFANFTWNYQPNNQSEVPNGGGHNSVTAIDGNGLALVDFSQAGHVNKNLAYMADGGGRYAAVEANADNTASNTASDTAHVNGATAASISDGAGRAQAGFDSSGYLVNGRNAIDLLKDGIYRRAVSQSTELIDNGNFEASTTLPIPGWQLGFPSLGFGAGASIGYWTSNPFQGTQSLHATATATSTGAAMGRILICQPNEQYVLTFALASQNAKAGLFFYDASGTYKGEITASTTSTSWALFSANGVVPAGATQAMFAVTNLASSGTTDMYLDAVSIKRIALMDTEVADGTIYGRTSQNDLYVSGGVNRVGLRVAGSGHVIGNQLNAPNSLTLNYGAARTATACTADSTGAVSINAFSVNMGGTTVSYNAVSNAITGLVVGDTYQIYCHDAGGTGGTKTWLAYLGTSTGLLTLGDDVVLAGQVTIPSSGTSGGGGTGTCVCDDMFIDDSRTAGDARPGDVFDCLDLPTTGMRKFRRRLHSVDYDTVACMRITTDTGAILECSLTTPFDVLDGRTVYAPDMLGEHVVTDKGIETVARVDDIGMRRVCHIHLGGVSYAAGADPSRRIYSHNALKP